MTRIVNGSAWRPALPDGRNSASHDPSSRVSTWRRLHVRARPPQQVGPGRDRPAPQGKPAEPAVGQHQHAGLQPVDQLSGKRVLPGRVGADHGVDDRVRAALDQRHHPGLRERRPLALVHPGPPEVLVVDVGVGDIETRPVDRDQPPPASHAPGVADRRQRLQRPDRTTPSAARAPTASRAWKIADFDGNFTGSASRNDHANPSVNNPSTSSYEPSECNAIPIAKYAITRAGNDRCRCSVRPDSAITSSTTSGGNTRVNTPTDTRSDNRRSDSGFTQPARGTHPNYTAVILTERYCD